MRITLIDLDAPSTRKTVKRWDAVLGEDPAQTYDIDRAVWVVQSHSADTGQGTMEIQARRRPPCYVIGIWNSNFDKPRRYEILNVDDASSAFDSLLSAIQQARADAVPLLHTPPTRGLDSITVEPQNTTRITLTGHGVDIVETI
jgi:hypothetical protein